jgi:hypothetical protein
VSASEPALARQLRRDYGDYEASSVEPEQEQVSAQTASAQRSRVDAAYESSLTDSRYFHPHEVIDYDFERLRVAMIRAAIPRDAGESEQDYEIRILEFEGTVEAILQPREGVRISLNDFLNAILPEIAPRRTGERLVPYLYRLVGKDRNHGCADRDIISLLAQLIATHAALSKGVMPGDSAAGIRAEILERAKAVVSFYLAPELAARVNEGRTLDEMANLLQELCPPETEASRFSVSRLREIAAGLIS